MSQDSNSAASRRAEGIPLFDGGTTNEKGIVAPLAPVADEADGIGLTAFTPLGGEHHPRNQTLTAARGGRFDAIVAFGAADGVVPGLALLNAPRYTDPYGPPVLQVASEHGDWLEAAALAGEQAHLIAHVRIEQTTACNVQTRITGRDSSLAPLVIMTPRSAWWTCTAERGGGIAIWLECIRHFAVTPTDRDIIFTANTGHELGHVVLERYLQAQSELGTGAHAWLHLGANFIAVDSTLRYAASPDLLQLGLDAFAAEDTAPDVVTLPGIPPNGEAYNIYAAGGRYLSLIGANRWFHHPADRWPETVDLDRAGKLCRAVLRIADTLAGV